jgi:hypothetical protein
MKKSRSILAATIALTAVLTACDGSTDAACTEIGCNDGLFVVLRGTPGVEFEIDASTSNGDVRNASCVVDPDGSCQIGFYGFVPEDVTLAVSGVDQQLSVTLEPAYETFQPNGPGCPPICRQATLEINLQPSAQHS